MPNKSWAKVQVDNSVKSWLKLRGVIVDKETNLIEAMESLLMSSADLSYLENLQKCLTAIGDESAVNQVKRFLNAIETTINDAENYYQSAITFTQQGDYQGAITAIEQAIHLNPNESKFKNFRQQLLLLFILVKQSLLI